MVNFAIELQDLILKSLMITPCTEKEIKERDFLKQTSVYGVGLTIQRLENLGAIYYKKGSDVMQVSKKWIKENRAYLIND